MSVRTTLTGTHLSGSPNPRTFQEIEVKFLVGRLERYYDTNWISNVGEFKTTSGYVFTLGGVALFHGSLVNRPS